VPLVPLVLGIAGCVASYQLTLGSLVQPGPGLWPFAASAALLVASAVLLIQRVRTSDEQDEPVTAGAWRVAVATGLMALFAVAFVWVGLLGTLFVVLVVWLRFLSRESWRATLIYAVSVAVGFYVLFVVLLRIPFPGEFLPASLGGSL
jgi:hypothetical protein